MAVWASLLSSAQTSRMAAGLLCWDRARSTFLASTSTLPMPDPPPPAAIQVDTCWAGVPDCSWPAQPPQRRRPGRRHPTTSGGPHPADGGRRHQAG